MDKFGFIVHPVDIKQSRQTWFILKFFPSFFIKFILKYFPPFLFSKITQVCSKTGKEIEGYFILCPLLPEQMIKLNEKFVLSKIIVSCKIAERLGAKIVGLGGYTSVVGDKGCSIADSMNIPVTTGNTLTAWAVIDAILKMAATRNISLGKATLAIIGASGSIGSLCTRKLAYYFSRIIIAARRKEKLYDLQQEVLKTRNIEIIVEDDIHQAVKEADFVIITTSAPYALLDVNELKKDAVVCDVSIPKNIYGTDIKRNDVTIIPGGLIRLPSNVDFGKDIFLPKNVSYGCVAETMLLTLEGLFENYSLGAKIPLDRLDQIGPIAAKHGFNVWIGS